MRRGSAYVRMLVPALGRGAGRRLARAWLYPHLPFAKACARILLRPAPSWCSCYVGFAWLWTRQFRDACATGKRCSAQRLAATRPRTADRRSPPPVEDGRLSATLMARQLTGETILCCCARPLGGLWRNRHQIMTRLARHNTVVYVEPRVYLGETLAALPQRPAGAGRSAQTAVGPQSRRHGQAAPTVSGSTTIPYYAPFAGRRSGGPLTATLRRRALQRRRWRRLDVRRADPVAAAAVSRGPDRAVR